MMTAAMSRRAQELAARGEAFVTATVVRAQRPTSVVAGDVALVLGDGSIEGFIGGACAEHSVRARALEALRTGEAVLLRILPFAEEGAGAQVEDGAVTVQNPCLSGGAIEVFLEPVVPRRGCWWWARPRSRGDRAGRPGARARRRPGGGRRRRAAARRPRAGRGGARARRGGRASQGLEAGLPYVGLVASRARGDGVIGELRGDGVAEELLGRIDVPAGIEIGARTPGEIALSILAGIVAVRREAAAPPRRTSPARRRPRPPSTRSAG